ncbi:MAG: hypothetical protein HBSAPP01_12380 [Candidatus Brocadia sapporoensis]|nr:MAG: hypothetical protein HBSAPP01_12380 [Candidatus Brocadia sapporoensis]
MASLSGGLDALGPRKDLIITGFHIYWDHLFFGTGIGSFVETAVNNYSFLLPYGGRYVTHSHCAFVTIMAELGTIGVMLLLLILKELYNSFVKAKASNMEPMRSYLLCSFFACVLIFVNAQSIGRLIEEPLLWVFMGMTIAIEEICKKNTVDNICSAFSESEFLDMKSKTCRYG